MIADVVWGDESEGAQIGITVPKEVFATGEIINVTILLKNVKAEGSVRLIRTSAWSTYALDLFLSDGNAAERTLFGDMLQEDVNSDYRMITELPPGAISIMTLPLNRLFDLTLADEYELEVTRLVECHEGRGFAPVVSNRIVIEVSDEIDEGFSPEVII
jgi:hypothetical protein